MKIIHVAGFSNSGKTTFILDLIPALKEHGTVGVIKHLGHHRYADSKEEESKQKDTSRFSLHADLVAGVDAEKAVITVPNASINVSIEKTAALYVHIGISYTIIEGFKSIPCSKIWFGTPEQAKEADLFPYCILFNPTVDEVISSLDLFDVWNPDFFASYQPDSEKR
jgi:molybdopterin synthase catalytic subunit